MANDITQLISNPEMLGLERQRQMAQMLLKQGMQAPQGQMIGDRYVPANPMQYIGNLFNVYAGQKGLESTDQQELALAKALREKKLAETTDIMKSLTGTPEVATELAGPAYQGVIPQAVMPAVPASPQEALAKALKSETGAGNVLLPSIMEQVLPKQIPDQIKFKLAKEGGYTGTFNDFINQMTEADKARIAIDKQRLALEAANQNKPQIVETANGFVAVNPRNPAEATPVTVGGQPLMGTKANLPEGATKQVTGATNLKDAITNYKETLKKFSTLDMANPDARATMGNAYNNMMLQAKEAYNLGVLNGPDYQILQSVVKDPTSPSSLLVGKKTLEKQADDLSKQADVIIGNVYKTHNRNVPENLKSKDATNKPTQQFDPALLQYMTPEQRKLFGG